MPCSFCVFIRCRVSYLFNLSFYCHLILLGENYLHSLSIRDPFDCSTSARYFIATVERWVSFQVFCTWIIICIMCCALNCTHLLWVFSTLSLQIHRFVCLDFKILLFIFSFTAFSSDRVSIWHHCYEFFLSRTTSSCCNS